MSFGAAEDFVKSLKSKIHDHKIHEEFKRNLLQECLDCINEIFRKSLDFNLKSIGQFESKDSFFILDVSFNDDPTSLLKTHFEFNKIPYDFFQASPEKFCFRVDLGERIISSGNPHNFFFIDVYSKKNELYKLRISNSESEVKYFAIDKNYYGFSFWIFDGGFNSYQISLREINRDKKKQKIESIDGKYTINIYLNEIGEMSSFEVSKKRLIKSKKP